MIYLYIPMNLLFHWAKKKHVLYYLCPVKNLLFISWPRIFSLLENVSCVLDKDVYDAVVE